MNHFLKFLQVFALGTWLGSIIFFSFAVAPGVFGILASRDEAGLVVGFSLARLHGMGVLAAILFLVAAMLLAHSISALLRPAALGVVLMLIFTLVSMKIVIPRMDALRTQMRSIEATPPESPLRIEFDRLHGASVKLEGSVLLIGLIALFLTVTPAKEKS